MAPHRATLQANETKIIKEKQGLYMSKNISCLFISVCEVPSHGPISKKEPASHHFPQSVHLPARGYEYSVLTYNAWYLGNHSGSGLSCYLPFPEKNYSPKRREKNK